MIEFSRFFVCKGPLRQMTSGFTGATSRSSLIVRPDAIAKAVAGKASTIFVHHKLAEYETVQGFNDSLDHGDLRQSAE